MTEVFIKWKHLDTETDMMEGAQCAETEETAIYKQGERPETDPSLAALGRTNPTLLTTLILNL